MSGIAIVINQPRQLGHPATPLFPVTTISDRVYRYLKTDSLRFVVLYIHSLVFSP